jgi:hypothetical protein
MFPDERGTTVEPRIMTFRALMREDDAAGSCSKIYSLKVVSSALKPMKQESSMQKATAVLSLTLLLAMSYVVEAADEQQASSSAPDVQIVSSESQVKWGPAPAAVPEGAQAAVLNGDSI